MKIMNLIVVSTMFAAIGVAKGECGYLPVYRIDLGNGLHGAEIIGGIDAVKNQLEAGVNPNAFLSESGTMLMLAAHDGNFDLVKLYLDYCADPNPEYRGGVGGQP